MPSPASRREGRRVFFFVMAEGCVVHLALSLDRSSVPWTCSLMPKRRRSQSRARPAQGGMFCF